MDGKAFDTLVRATSEATSRRGALGLLLGGVLTAPLARLEPALGRRKGKNKKKKCRKLNQGCGGKKKKCCKGLTCTDGTCLNPQAPECDNDTDCGANEICDGGVCVPEQPECDSDSDCGDNQICDSGICICPAVVEDRCVIECVGSGDCPSGCDCRRLFPDNGERACVDDSALCSADSCDNSDDCSDDELCAEADCGGSGFVGRCFPVCVG